jgi:hypothetical protein
MNGTPESVSAAEVATIGHDVRIVLEVVLDDGDDDLRVVLVAVGEERTDRTVDQAGNQRFFSVGRPSRLK